MFKEIKRSPMQTQVVNILSMRCRFILIPNCLFQQCRTVLLQCTMSTGHNSAQCYGKLLLVKQIYFVMHSPILWYHRFYTSMYVYAHAISIIFSATFFNYLPLYHMIPIYYAKCKFSYLKCLYVEG